jgi:CBS domain-containing protein
MATAIRDVMTTNPIVYPATATIMEAAEGMREFDIGDVLVERDGKISGIVTDRDIVVRAVADGKPAQNVTVGEISTDILFTLAPSDTVEHAIQLMRDNSLRRLPVCEGDTAVGIVTLGDLAIARDGRSVLAAISASPPND